MFPIASCLPTLTRYLSAVVSFTYLVTINNSVVSFSSSSQNTLARSFPAFSTTTLASSLKNHPVPVSDDANIQTRFILVNTLHAGNVGATARAMKTMGFDDLVLVTPRDPKVLNRQRTKEGASGAMDVLNKARIVDTLEEALDGTDIYCSTGMPHDMYNERPFVQSSSQYVQPRIYFEQLMASFSNQHHQSQSQQQGQRKPLSTSSTPDDMHTTETSTSNIELPRNTETIRISFVFGNEKYGLSEDHMVKTCHVILGIPTNPKFGSLNLASSVQLIAYDWRLAIGGWPSTSLIGETETEDEEVGLAEILETKKI